MTIPTPFPRPVAPEREPQTLQVLLDGAEREFIVRALEDNGGSRKLAAAQLGISRSTLFNKMRKHGLLDASKKNGKDEAGETAETEAKAAPRAPYPYLQSRSA